jgi:hypothetical protein
MVTLDESFFIHGNQWWVKIVEMLQQNWAIIQTPADGDGVVVLFVADDGGVFDEMPFSDAEHAARSLRMNGFEDLSASKKQQTLLSPPTAPFAWRDHPNGRIYSSGRFWRS